MKILKHPLFWALIGFGLAVAVSYAIAQTKDSDASVAKSETIEYVVRKPACDPVLHPAQNPTDCHYQKPKVTTQLAEKPQVITMGENLKSPHPIDSEKLRVFLGSSPLALYSEQIVKSDFAALIIGICWIEQYSCKKAPYNNYWGMMKPGGGLQRFNSLPEALEYMNGYFTRLYPKKPTVESLRGYYCASACSTWEPTVLKIKNQIESL